MIAMDQKEGEMVAGRNPWDPFQNVFRTLTPKLQHPQRTQVTVPVVHYIVAEVQ